MDTGQQAEEGYREVFQGVLCLTGMGSGMSGSGRLLGLGQGPHSPALLRASLSCIFSSGDCTAHYYFHMFLQEIIEGKYMNSPLFGMLTGYRNVCR